MSTVTEEMRDAIIKLAGERAFFETREVWLARAARRAGISQRQAKAFFYREASSPRHQDVEAVRLAVSTLNSAEGARDSERRDREQDRELEELRAIVERLEAVADRFDEHRLRADAGAIRDVARRARAKLNYLGEEP